VEIASRLSSTSAAVADETLSIIPDTQTNQLRLPAVVCHKLQKHRSAMEGTTTQHTRVKSTRIANKGNTQKAGTKE